MSSVDTPDIGQVAIVGMACRFPGAASVAEYWDLLCGGREGIRPIARDTLIEAGVPAHVVDSASYVRAAAPIDDVEYFDAAFFGCTPRQAELLDPQHRHLLECAWTALEDAGCEPDDDARRTGVFAGASLNSYLFATQPRAGEESPTAQFERMLANDEDFLATRVSYLLGLRGPGLTVQTACSTSLVAVHLACQSLAQYECDTAIAGGVTIRVPHVTGYRYVPGGIVSPDGHCRAFDARAAGTVFGSGVGLVVLKRLEDARADGHRIRAVIRGSAINNDGGDKVGFTAPSVNGQTLVVRQAQANAGVTAQSIGYIEAHGTGTQLGDPIEVAALARVFAGCPPQSCRLGSVKTNIGHLDAAAGVAGLIKAALAVEQGIIPPSLHFEAPNPEIDFARTPFTVNTQIVRWPSDPATPRRAGVSSFGIGGTNAHVIVEQPPQEYEQSAAPDSDSDSETGSPSPGESRFEPETAVAPRPQLIVWSARSAAAADAIAERLRAHLAAADDRSASDVADTGLADTARGDITLADVAWTLQTGRRRLSYRACRVCATREEAVALLAQAERPDAICETRTDRPVIFMFPGQGAQYAGMAADLYRDLPVFRDTIDRCATRLRPLIGQDLRAWLVPASGDWHTAREALSRTLFAQPALFSVEYALAQVWQAWGIRPAALIGHSLGEWVAACVGGACSLDDALALVAERGRLMELQPAGAMLAVRLPEETLRARLPHGLSLAAINGPAQCVVSGTEAAIAAFARTLPAASTGPLAARRAFHSAMMDPIREPFAAAVARVPWRRAAVPIVSNVTGAWLDADITQPAYWARQLREPVRFADGLATLAAYEPEALFLEVGPGQTLTAAARAAATPARPLRVAASLPSAPRASSLRAAPSPAAIGAGATVPSDSRVAAAAAGAAGGGTAVADDRNDGTVSVTADVIAKPAADHAARVGGDCDDVAGQAVAVATERPSELQPDLSALLAALGQLWIAGAIVDWRAVHHGERRRRVPLPTYPFERQRYWAVRPPAASRPPDRESPAAAASTAPSRAISGAASMPDAASRAQRRAVPAQAAVHGAAHASARRPISPDALIARQRAVIGEQLALLRQLPAESAAFAASTRRAVRARRR